MTPSVSLTVQEVWVWAGWDWMIYGNNGNKVCSEVQGQDQTSITHLLSCACINLTSHHACLSSFPFLVHGVWTLVHSPPTNRMIHSRGASQQQFLPLQLLLTPSIRDTPHSGQQVKIIWSSQISQWFCLAERRGPPESFRIRIIHHRSSSKVKPSQLLPHSRTTKVINHNNPQVDAAGVCSCVTWSCSLPHAVPALVHTTPIPSNNLFWVISNVINGARLPGSHIKSTTFIYLFIFTITFIDPFHIAYFKFLF